MAVSNPHYTNKTLTALVRPCEGQEWWLTGVYGPQLDHEKIDFMQELIDIRDLHMGPWVVMGDFNLLVNPKDKSNESINRRMMARFHKRHNMLELKELYLNGRRYTWSNERARATMDKIDHIFCTNSWEDWYPNNLLTALSTAVSDHSPMLPNLDAELNMGGRFKFESFWTKADGFFHTARDPWESASHDGNPYVILDQNLRATAKALKKWSDRWVGNIKMQIAIAPEVIIRLDTTMDTRDLSPQERELRKILKRKLLGLSSLERTIARLRSSLLFLCDGDANTKFFHSHTRHRQRRNMIIVLRQGEAVAMGQDELSCMVDGFYDRLLGDAPLRTHALNLEVLNLPHRDLTHLEVPFMEEEIEQVIKSMPMDKARGLDGFTGRFYASCCHIIKDDIMRAMDLFHQGDMRGLPAINKAIVTLLPKIDGAVDLKNFRLVSLMHGAIKIFDGAMAVRLASDLPTLVGIHQSAFIRGRSIHDNFMMVQCMTRRLHALREPTIMLKLDITRALEVMRTMGFGVRWIEWVCGPLATASP